MIYIPRYYVYMELDLQGGTWRLKNRIIDTDVLIIGGGTAGCLPVSHLEGRKTLMY